VLGRLRDNAMRCFTIDIETDSTIEPNETEEKAQTTELLTALGNMIAQWGRAIEAQPALAPMAGEFLKFALRKFRTGRQLEDVIDQTIDNRRDLRGRLAPTLRRRQHRLGRQLQRAHAALAEQDDRADLHQPARGATGLRHAA
jgi:hypothetical protein